MNSGAMRSWVEFQSPANVTADNGQMMEAPWTTYHECFAEVLPDGGGEGVQQDQVVATRSWTVSTWWVDGVNPEHRIKHGSKILEVISVIDPTQRGMEMRVKAVEVV